MDEKQRPAHISAEDWECLNPSEQHARLSGGVLENDLGRFLRRLNGKPGPRLRQDDQTVGYELLVGLGLLLILGVAAAIAWILWAVVLSTPAHPASPALLSLLH